MHPEERNGADWQSENQDDAQAQSWKLLRALAASVRVGDLESELHERLKILSARRDLFPDFEKMWHPAKLRCGRNSVKSFREISEPNVALGIGDLLFIDIGPVFSGYEGDVGETYVMTAAGPSQNHPLCRDVRLVWERVAHRWSQGRVPGQELYAYASAEAERLGWKLNLAGASGHRIGDFPHHVHWRGTLRDFSAPAAAGRWILEIQLRDPHGEAGAFYEDILK